MSINDINVSGMNVRVCEYKWNVNVSDVNVSNGNVSDVNISGMNVKECEL